MDSTRKKLIWFLTVATTGFVYLGIRLNDWLASRIQNETNATKNWVYFFLIIFLPIIVSGILADLFIKYVPRIKFIRKWLISKYIDGYYVVEWWDKNKGNTYAGNELTRFHIDEEFILTEYSINWNTANGDDDPTCTPYVEYKYFGREYIGKFEYFDQAIPKEALSCIKFKADFSKEFVYYDGDINGIHNGKEYNEIHSGKKISKNNMKKIKTEEEKKSFLLDYEKKLKRVKGVTVYQGE